MTLRPGAQGRRRRLGSRASSRSSCVGALTAPWLLPWDPATQDLPNRLQGPTWQHWFGLDELGRDILARVLLGARVSLLVGVVVVGVSSIVGHGDRRRSSGYYGGRVDQVIGRVMDVLMAFPGMLLAIALVAVLGPSLVNVVLALDGDRLGRLCAPGSRPGAARARVRVRHGGAGARRRHACAILVAARPADARCRRCWCRRRSAWPARSSRKRR